MERQAGGGSITIMEDFYLPENESYTILDSMRDSVRFAVDRTLVPYGAHVCCKSSFVDHEGDVMEWHEFGNLEGPGWAANAVGGAYEIHALGGYMGDEQLERTAVSLLDHVLEDGFIDYGKGFITGYRDTADNRFCLNFNRNSEWFCAGSMARVAHQLLILSDLVGGQREDKMHCAAMGTADWLEARLQLAPNGWYPRRSTPRGEPYPRGAQGEDDPLFQKSGDGLFIIHLLTELTRRGIADYATRIHEKVRLFMELGGLFGSINHDTCDEHECVAYAVAFRVLREAAHLLGDAGVRSFAYERCLSGLDQFRMAEDRNGCRTKGLLFMETSWDTAYLWENAEAALAYLEAFSDTGNEAYYRDGVTILRAAAIHHRGPYGFLTEGVDWNNHVGAQHHFDGAQYGDIKYTEPLLNNLHIVEPTLKALSLKK